MPETEAQRAIRQALYEMQLMRGNGVFDLPALRRILELGLPREPARMDPAPKLLTRAAAQAAGLLDLDDNGGR